MKKSQKKFILEAYQDDDVCQGYKDKIKEHFPKVVKKLEKQKLPEPGDYVEIEYLYEGCQGARKGVYQVLPNNIKGFSGLFSSDKGFNIVSDKTVWRVNAEYRILNAEEVLKHRIEECQVLAEAIGNTSLRVSIDRTFPGCSASPIDPNVFGGCS